MGKHRKSGLGTRRQRGPRKRKNPLKNSAGKNAGPPKVQAPKQLGQSAVLIKEAVKTENSSYPVTRFGWVPPYTHARTLPLREKKPFHLKAVANLKARGTKFRTRHNGTYVGEQHLSHWGKQDRLNQAVQFPGI